MAGLNNTVCVERADVVAWSAAHGGRVITKEPVYIRLWVKYDGHKDVDKPWCVGPFPPLELLGALENAQKEFKEKWGVNARTGYTLHHEFVKDGFECPTN